MKISEYVEIFLLMDRWDSYSENGNPSKSSHKFYPIPNKIPTQFFTNLKGQFLIFIWKHKNPRTARTILN